MDASIRSRSAVLTILVHAGLFLILFLTAMTIKIPPFPEAGGGGGVLVNIGMLAEAGGEIQPMSPETTTEPVIEESKPVLSPDEKIATQEFEEAPISKKVTETKKVTPKKTETKPREIKKVEPQRVPDKRALYAGKTTASQSQGTGTGKGDQGDPLGDPNSKYTGKAGSGTGGQGGGTGSGTGDGSGLGGPGKGISFSLSGRKMIKSPQINDQSQETGKVVVDITVDKSGSVVSAIPGGRGSTTTSSLLFRLAKEAAMRARFNESPDNADIQKGTMTFVFVLQ